MDAPFVLTSVSGLTLSKADENLLSQPAVAGVIFFAKNYVSPQQLHQLIHDIKQIRPNNFLLAVDQEGGRVQRFTDGFTCLPPLGDIGRVYDMNVDAGLAYATAHATVMAKEVISAGVDFSFAPVLDVNIAASRVIADRAFHIEPKIVGNLGIAYIQALQACGMAAVAKHFPGHGSVEADSHREFPVDQRPWLDIIEHDGLPFQQAIKSGLKAIMPAHVVYQAYSELPAGFSRLILQDYLRQSLGFKGIIISDDLDMAGASVVGDHVSRANAALDAGCDFIILCHNAPAVMAIVDEVSCPYDNDQQLNKIQQLQASLTVDLVNDPDYLQAKGMLRQFAEMGS